MKRISGLIMILAWMLTSCGTGPGGLQFTATPGTDPVAAGVQLIQQDMILRLTQQEIEARRIEAGAQMTATQQVLGLTATAARQNEEGRQTQAASAATKTVWNVTVAAAQAQDTATAEAQASATAQAFVAATTTAAAQATATQAAVLGLTATVAAEGTESADQKTRQAPIDEARARELAAQAESAELAAARERMTNGVMAWGPWAGFAVAMGAAIYFARKYLRIRAFKPDERGDAPYLVIDGTQVIDLDGMPGALLDLKTQTAPMLTSIENAAQIKARDQFIDLNTRGLPNQFQERKATGQMPMAGPGVKIELAPYAEVQKLLGSAETQLNDEEIGR
jgi:hypothetical protein